MGRTRDNMKQPEISGGTLEFCLDDFASSSIPLIFFHTRWIGYQILVNFLADTYELNICEKWGRCRADQVNSVRSSLEGALALNPNMLLAKSLTSCLAYPNNPLLAFCSWRLVWDMMKCTKWLFRIVSGHKNFKAGDKNKVFSHYKVVLHLHRHSKKIKDNFNSCGRHLFLFFFDNSGGVVLQALKGRIYI